MRILLASEVFPPAVGGVETMALILANEFVSLGHEVVVVTNTPSDEKARYPFEVLRRPGRLELLRRMRWCNVFFQNNISLKSLWPLLLVKRPWVVAHHTWIRRTDGSLAWQDHLKRYLLRFAAGISVSRAMADDLPVASTVIGNPYDDRQFRVLSEVEKDRDIVFLGRLVSDKGPDLLLCALHDLVTNGESVTATFIGAGPELDVLKRRSVDWGLETRVQFVGQMSGEALVRLLNRHRIMAVPSRWNEPFGLVALEGIACGCAVVGSEGGGLKDAMGPCGMTFKNGDVNGLTAALTELLHSPAAIRNLTGAAPAHLAQHKVRFVAGRYLAVLAHVMEGQ